MSQYHKFVTFGSGPNGVQWRWVNYYHSASDFTPTSAQMIAWMTACWATISGRISNNWNVYGIGYSPWEGGDDFLNSRGWGATVVYPVTLAGASVSEALPSQSAAVILGRTATKRVIGKKFVAGIGEADQNTGIPSAALVTAMTNLGGFMYTSTYDMGGVALSPRVWGTHHGFTPTVSSSNSVFLGTQRRRKPGVGI